MTFKSLLAGTAITLMAATAHAGDTMSSIMIHDAYARASSPVAKAGAAFMEIMNHGDTDDRLISATTDAAVRVELHTHIDAGDGVTQMREVEGGFVIPAGETYVLKRGGDHVMMMGLTDPFVDGEAIEITFTFEKAGEVTVEIPIDLQRQAEHGATDHSGHNHGGHSTKSN